MTVRKVSKGVKSDSFLTPRIGGNPYKQWLVSFFRQQNKYLSKTVTLHQKVS